MGSDEVRKGGQMVTTFVCEYCGYSEPYGSNIGQDPAAVVRARVVRHEQRCEKNPLVKAIKDIRGYLEELRDDATATYETNLFPAIRLTYDCFLDQTPEPKTEKTMPTDCIHRNTHTGEIESLPTDIEICDDCGMSRVIYKKYKPSRWARVDLEEARKEWGSNNPDTKKRRSPEPKPIRPPTMRIVPEKIRGRRKATDGYYGTSLMQPTGKWKAQAQSKGRNRYLGTFVIEEEAAIAVQEHLGNNAEADRIRQILAAKQGTAGKQPAVGFSHVPAGGIGIAVASKDQPGKLKVVIESPKERARRLGEKRIEEEANQAAENEKQESVAAAGMANLEDECTWQWVCVGCSEAMPRKLEKCPKCNGMSFEKIQVLKDPQGFLDRPEGRHN